MSVWSPSPFVSTNRKEINLVWDGGDPVLTSEVSVPSVHGRRRRPSNPHPPDHTEGRLKTLTQGPSSTETWSLLRTSQTSPGVPQPRAPVTGRTRVWVTRQRQETVGNPDPVSSKDWIRTGLGRRESLSGGRISRVT